jgi:hypothetical protein
MSMYKVGAKVRIQPQYLGEWHHRTPERGHTVVKIGDKNALLESGIVVPWERLAPDIDMPWDPVVPQKTLAEKELEVLQQDPIRRRWQELLGPAPEYKVKIDFFPFKALDSVKNKTSPFFPPGEYTLSPEQALDFMKRQGIVLNKEATRGLNLGEVVHDVYYPRKGTVRGISFSEGELIHEVQWEGGAMSWRPRSSLRAEDEQTAENERLSTYFAEKTPGFNPHQLQKWSKSYADAQETYRSVTGRSPPEPEFSPRLRRRRANVQNGDEVEVPDGCIVERFVDAKNSFFQAREAEALVETEKKVAEALRPFKIGDRVRLIRPCSFLKGIRVGATGLVVRPVPEDGYQIGWDAEYGGGYSSEFRAALELVNPEPYWVDVEIAGFKAGDQVLSRAPGKEVEVLGKIVRLQREVHPNSPSFVPSAYICIDFVDGSSRCGNAGSILANCRRPDAPDRSVF